jgi:uncharacterized protein YbbC (DUF1343 family)
MPFSVLGSPDLKGIFTFSFTPVSMPGKSETPLHQDKVCYGLDLRNYDMSKIRKSGKVNIKWLMDMYKVYPFKEKFFDRTQSKQMGNIDGLAGTTLFKEQIKEGKSEEEIRESWEPGLSKYKAMRKKYTMYL